jgi:hypothetical protein
VVTFVKKSFADGAAAIKIKGDKGLPALVTDPFSHERTRIGDFAYGFVEHSGELFHDAVVRDGLADHWRESYVRETGKSMKAVGLCQ